MDNLQACSSYVYPTIGSFDVHASGVERNLTRENFFKSHPQCNRAVIPCAGEEPRRCCTFGPRNHWEVLGDYVFDAEDAVWWTTTPPSSPHDPDACWQRLLIANDWLDSWMQWVGPPQQLFRKGKGKGKHNKPYAVDVWKELRDSPSQMRDLQ